MYKGLAAKLDSGGLGTLPDPTLLPSPAISLRFTILRLLLPSPAISLGFHILLLLLSSAISLGFTNLLLLLLPSPVISLVLIILVRFLLCMWPFFNPTPEVVTFHLHGCDASQNVLFRTYCTVCRWQDCLFVGCLTSQQHASVSHGRICSDNFTCCHTEIKVADPTFYLTQSQYTDTRPTSPSADPIMPDAWQGSHWSANF